MAGARARRGVPLSSDSKRSFSVASTWTADSSGSPALRYLSRDGVSDRCGQQQQRQSKRFISNPKTDFFLGRAVKPSLAAGVLDLRGALGMSGSLVRRTGCGLEGPGAVRRCGWDCGGACSRGGECCRWKVEAPLSVSENPSAGCSGSFWDDSAERSCLAWKQDVNQRENMTRDSSGSTVVAAAAILSCAARPALSSCPATTRAVDQN